MQTTTYYVHETTNTRFTFENCGGCLKQIRKKIVRLLEPLIQKRNNNEYEATNILFTFENRGGALKQTEKKIARLLEPLKYNFNEQ